MNIGREYLSSDESTKIFECKCFSGFKTKSCYARKIYAYDQFTGKKDQEDEREYQLYNISREDINSNNAGRFIYNAIPAYSIYDLISMLPDEVSVIQGNEVIKFNAYIDILDGYLKYSNDTMDLHVESNNEIIDSLYKMAIWYNKNLYSEQLINLPKRIK